MVGFVMVVMGAITFLGYYYPAMHPALIYTIGLSLGIILFIPPIVWHSPRIGLYLLYTASLVLPGFPIPFRATMPTSYVPFWWNISSIGQYFAGTNATSSVVISPAEIMMVVTLLTWLVHRVVTRDLHLLGGRFFWIIAAYTSLVALGFLHGLAKHCNVTIALYEVRAQAYFFLAYLLAVNLFTDIKQIKNLLWITTIMVGIQGIFGAVTYFSLNGTVTEDGFMSHDESIFLNLLLFIAILSPILKVDKRLSITAWALLPPSIIAVLGNQRRASIAAFLIAFLPLFPILWVILKERRKLILQISMAVVITASIYLPIAWNGKGAWALPARAIRSQTDPDTRDASSDYYRYAETVDLKATRDEQPWTGIGYGIKFTQVLPLPMVTTDILYYMPHNSIMWVWMRIGHFGFFCFLMMVATFLISGVQVIRTVQAPTLRMIGLLALALLLMTLTFGKFDLALVNLRIMVCVGILLGILAVLPKFENIEKHEANDYDDPLDLSQDTDYTTQANRTGIQF